MPKYYLIKCLLYNQESLLNDANKHVPLYINSYLKSIRCYAKYNL